MGSDVSESEVTLKTRSAVGSSGGSTYLLCLILTIHTGLLGYNAYVHSPTLNEPAHLVAGLSHWKFGRYELYRVNPPLVRMVAALPVMAVGYEEDWSDFHDGPGSRPVFTMGENFVAANGERSFFLFMIARWACIPFSWLAAIVCYMWARDLFGPTAGVLAAGLWCFEPTILAHASLLTPDAHASALALAAGYVHWRWIQNPTWGACFLSGTTLALAQLTKSTHLILYPLFLLLWVCFRPRGRRGAWRIELVMLLATLFTSVGLLNFGYRFEGTCTPLCEYRFVSNLLGGDDEVRAETPLLATWIEELPLCLPRDYVLGLDVQQRDFEDYGGLSFLRGEWGERGWWYYYAYSALVKTPIGILGLVALVVCGAMARVTAPNGRFVLLIALAYFGLVSSKTGFSEHYRYVIPALPFLFVWIGQVVPLAMAEGRTSKKPWYLLRGRMPILVYLFALTVVMSSLFSYPHGISYFNELVGGPAGGPRHLLGSNVDWGQDLRYLSRYMDRELDSSDRLYLAYHGPVSPADLGMRNTKQWPDEFYAIAEEQYYAVSVNILYGNGWAARGGDAPPAVIDEDILRAFRGRRPHRRIGYSILVFHLPAK